MNFGIVMSILGGFATAVLLCWFAAYSAHKRAEARHPELRRMPVVGFTIADWWAQRKGGLKPEGFAPSSHRGYANKLLFNALFCAFASIATLYSEREYASELGFAAPLLRDSLYLFAGLAMLSGAVGFSLLIREIVNESRARYLYRVMAQPSRNPVTGEDVPTSESEKQAAQDLAELMTGKRPPKWY